MTSSSWSHRKLPSIIPLREARILDASGHEAKRRQARIEHDINSACRNVRDQKEKIRKADVKKAAVLSTELNTDKSKLAHVTKPVLKAQLAVYRVHGDSEIPKKKDLKYKADVLRELLAALTRYEVRLQLNEEKTVPFAVTNTLDDELGETGEDEIEDDDLDETSH